MSVVTWTHQEGDRYLVTGVDTKGRKFRLVYDNWHMARCINLWRGRIWHVPKDGRRKLLRRVWN